MEQSENFVLNDIRQLFDRPIELEVIKWTGMNLELLMQLLAYDFDITTKYQRRRRNVINIYTNLSFWCPSMWFTVFGFWCARSLTHSLSHSHACTHFFFVNLFYSGDFILFDRSPRKMIKIQISIWSLCSRINWRLCFEIHTIIIDQKHYLIECHSFYFIHENEVKQF